LIVKSASGEAEIAWRMKEFSTAAACVDIPENPVRKSGIPRITRFFHKLTRAG